MCKFKKKKTHTKKPTKSILKVVGDILIGELQLN